MDCITCQNKCWFWLRPWNICILFCGCEKQPLFHLQRHIQTNLCSQTCTCPIIVISFFCFQLYSLAGLIKRNIWQTRLIYYCIFFNLWVRLSLAIWLKPCVMLQFLFKFTVLLLLANDIKSNLFKNLDRANRAKIVWLLKIPLI